MTLVRLAYRIGAAMVVPLLGPRVRGGVSVISTGHAAAVVYALGSGLARPLYIAPMFVVQLGIIVLVLSAYRRAGTLARRPGVVPASGRAAPPAGG